MPFRIGLVLFSAMFLATAWSHSAQGKDDEEQVRAAWTALQAAIKAKDADKIWALVDADTQADADRAVKNVQAAYKRASAKEKAAQEKFLGLTGDEIAKLAPAGLFKTKRFMTKYDEIPDSKIIGITVLKDTATLNYLEPDMDKEKLTYNRQGGKWKANMPLPKFIK